MNDFVRDSVNLEKFKLKYVFCAYIISMLDLLKFEDEWDFNC